MADRAVSMRRCVLSDLEWQNVNWTAFVLGIAIVGLEVGMIFMYKVGWNVNTGYIVKAIILAIMLIIVGYLLYKEPIKATKIVGVAVCLAGLFPKCI
ncbi:MAG: hypothetical protein IJI45_10045 [Anaerolineaceae bacterium]|nr:hypothetical protein [Anaerolineaceae bacterium]